MFEFVSDEELFCQRMAKRLADADNDQSKTKEGEAEQRINRPEIKSFDGGEGDRQKDFQHNAVDSRQNTSASENEEISMSDVTAKCDHGCDDQRASRNDGKGKAEKPMTVCMPIDEKQISSNCGKITRNENDGIRTAEPSRQERNYIREQQTADRIQ